MQQEQRALPSRENDIETGLVGDIEESVLDYSPRMDDFERQFMQLNRMVSSAEEDDDNMDATEDVGPNRKLSGLSGISEGVTTKRSGSKERPLDESARGSSFADEIGVGDTTDIDFEMWESAIPPPPSMMDAMPAFEGLDLEESQQDDEERQRMRTLLSSLPPSYEERFQQDAGPVRLVVSKVPEEVLKAQQAEIDAAKAKRRLDILNATKKRERSLLQREHMARARLEQMEADATEKLRRERTAQRLQERESHVRMGLDFRRAREEMEQHLEAKGAQLREVFGEVTADQKLSRRFTVEWARSPQPVEVRERLPVQPLRTSCLEIYVPVSV